MGIGKVLLFFCICTIGSVFNTVTGQSWQTRCPPSAELSPCRCAYGADMSRQDKVLNYYCAGATVTQEDIAGGMRLIRQANNVTENESLYFGEIRIYRTQMLTADLTPFLHLDIGEFDWAGSNVLQRLTGPPLEVAAGLINATRVSITHTVMNDEVFGETLKYFNPKQIVILSLLANHNITGTPDRNSTNMEFLPGLWDLTNLASVELSLTGIRKLQGGQFRKMNRLSSLHLGYCDIGEIGPDAFLFDPLPVGYSNRLAIYLYYQNGEGSDTSLNSTSWVANHALDNNQQRIDLSLMYDQMETIPQKVFKNFLDIRSDNSLDVSYNPIHCDPRAKWLKEGRLQYESRVVAHCANDWPRTVFNSPLVD